MFPAHLIKNRNQHVEGHQQAVHRCDEANRQTAIECNRNNYRNLINGDKEQKQKYLLVDIVNFATIIGHQDGHPKDTGD